MPLPLLSHPDIASWRAHPRYSPLAAQALRQAFGQIASPLAGADDFLSACLIIAPWLNRELAAEQRVRAYWLFARTLEAEGNYGQALHWADDALEAAARGRAQGELIELLAYHGRLQRGLGRFPEASADLCESLDALYTRHGDVEEVDPALRLELLAQLATYEFLLARYEPAQHLADEACQLFAEAPTSRLAAASVLWVQAHLLRTQQQPERALPVALEAAEIHAHEAPIISQGRIEIFVAEVAMDVAERVPAGPAAGNHKPFLDLARVHLMQAERLTRAAHDRPGAQLAKLARVRASRLGARMDDRVAPLDAVITTAERIDDGALLAQALTALGHELAAQCRWAQARALWRRAVEVAEVGGFPALGGSARRALLRHDELDPDA